MKKSIACGALAIVALILPFCGYELAPESESSGLFPIIQNDKYGYINKTGQVVIEPQFDEATSFSEGLAQVKIANRDGYIDKSGKYVINPQFKSAQQFSEGLAAVWIGDKSGYIDKIGRVVIEIELRLGRWTSPFYCPPFACFDVSPWKFSEGLASVKIGDKSGYIDKTGRVVIDPEFDEATSFSESLAQVEIDDVIGYINKTGQVVIEPQFDYALGFSEGLAAVGIGDKSGYKWGYIEKSGKYVINPQFDHASSFSKGLAQVDKGLGRWVNFDKAGRATLGDVIGDKYGYIDTRGQHVWNAQD